MKCASSGAHLTLPSVCELPKKGLVQAFAGAHPWPHSFCDPQRSGHPRMIYAVEGDRARMPDHGFAAGSGRQHQIEALVARRRRVLEKIPIDPDDRIARTNSCRHGTELHLVDDDSVHPGCGCRRAGWGQSQDGSRYCKRQWSNGKEPSNCHRRFFSSCSACFWCSWNRLRPVSRSDLSSALLAPGISVVFSAPFTVRWNATSFWM